MMMYSIPPRHVGQDFVVVLQDGGVVMLQDGVVVGVAATTHLYPPAQTSHGSVVGQMSHWMDVAAQSTHSMTVTVFGFGHTSIGTCPRSNRSRFTLVGGEVSMGLIY